MWLLSTTLTTLTHEGVVKVLVRLVLPVVRWAIGQQILAPERGPREIETANGKKTVMTFPLRLWAVACGSESRWHQT